MHNELLLSWNRRVRYTEILYFTMLRYTSLRVIVTGTGQLYTRVIEPASVFAIKLYRFTRPQHAHTGRRKKTPLLWRRERQKIKIKIKTTNIRQFVVAKSLSYCRRATGAHTRKLTHTHACTHVHTYAHTSSLTRSLAHTHPRGKNTTFSPFNYRHLSFGPR